MRFGKRLILSQLVEATKSLCKKCMSEFGKFMTKGKSSDEK